MKAETGGVMLVVLLALGTVFYSQNGVPSPTGAQSSPIQNQLSGQAAKEVNKAAPGKAATDQSSTEKVAHSCYQGADRLIRDFFAQGLKKKQSGIVSIAQKEKYNLKFIITTLPDPVYSRVGWRYDLYLDAIQRALEANGYVPDRFSLPWECPSANERGEYNRPPRLQEEEPGVILFRHNDTNELLVLFLIGEMPTSGIHKRAFYNALTFIADNSSQEVCPTEIRLLGPSFSGSATSLKMAIKEWYETEWQQRNKTCLGASIHFTITSGSATSDTNKRILKLKKEKEQLIDFHATVIPDSVMMEKLNEYLFQMDRDAKVAVLKESNTGYGRGLNVSDRSDRSLAGYQNHDGRDAYKTSSNRKWLTLPFPMHISGMRMAYERDPLLKDRPAQAPGNVNPPVRSTLELPMDDMTQSRDVVPALASSMTSVAVESVLANILSTISREGIKYVGLIATDTKDKLFLARQIRKYCPDVRLFTLESDLLYTHPSYSSYLEGMIVVSTYPLFNRNQIWSYPFSGTERRLQFSAHGAQGIYNAMLGLLNYDAEGCPSEALLCITPKTLQFLSSKDVSKGILDDLQRKRSKRFIGKDEFRMDVKSATGNKLDAFDSSIAERVSATPPPFLEYSMPFNNYLQPNETRPPVWLTVVGHGRFWPLRVYTDYEDKSSYLLPVIPPLNNQDSTSSESSPPSDKWQLKSSWFAFVLFFLFGIFCTINCIGFIVMMYPQPGDVLPISPLEVFRLDAYTKKIDDDDTQEDRRKQLHRWRALYIAICFSTLLSVCTVLAFVAFIPTAIDIEQNSWTPHTVWTLISIWFLVFATMLSALSAFLQVIQPKLHYFRKRAGNGSNEKQEATTTESKQEQTEQTERPAKRASRAKLVWYRVLRQPLSWSGAFLSVTSLIASAGLCYLPVYIWSPKNTQIADTIILYDRWTNITGGVSPIVPIAFLSAGIYLWSFFQLKRLRMREADSVALPFSLEPVKKSSESTKMSLESLPIMQNKEIVVAGASAFEDYFQNALKKPFSGMIKSFVGLGLLAALAIPCLIIWWRFLRTFESKAFDYIFLSVFLLVYFLIALAFVRFISIWYYFNQLLRLLAAHCSADAYDRLPQKYSRILGSHFLTRMPVIEELELPVKQLRRLEEHLKQMRSDRPKLEGLEKLPNITALRKATDLNFSRETTRVGERGRRITLSHSDTQRCLLRAARQTAFGLQPFWNTRKFKQNGAAASNTQASKPTIDSYVLPFAEDIRVWVKLAEDFIAIQVVTFISKVFIHLRHLLTFVTIAAFLMLLAVGSYPFQPHRLMAIFMWIIILSVVAASIIIFVQAERNEVLSRIAKTAPNQVTMDRWFISGIVTYGLLPILGLLFTQVPEMQGIFSWVEPVLRAFK